MATTHKTSGLSVGAEGHSIVSYETGVRNQTDRIAGCVRKRKIRQKLCATF